MNIPLQRFPWIAKEGLEDDYGGSNDGNTTPDEKEIKVKLDFTDYSIYQINF